VVSLPPLGVILWAAASCWDMWRAPRDPPNGWVTVAQGALTLLTTGLLAAGMGAAFFLVITLLTALTLVAVGGSMLVDPPGVGETLGHSISMLGLRILFAALCWALS
jgi:hypothetical protein